MTIKRNTITRKDQCEGFTRLLKKCLDLQENDEILVIYDESLEEFFGSLLEVIESDLISATFLYIPKSYQKFLVRTGNSDTVREKIPLPSGVISAISTAAAIINLLDGEPENASLRRTINHTNRLRTCRLATIPGISSEIIQTIVQSPIDEILRDCERIAWALGESHHVELLSYDAYSQPYFLSLNLNGWEGEPIMSPGVLLPGSWGNVPPGETFCCPKHETVNGEICINGSVPGRILRPGEEVVLRFEYGKLVSWRAPEYTNVAAGSPGISFLEQEKARAERNEDSNWNTFAELGIGLNPVITDLTGNSLFDEKAKQSIHIAIGDNSAFGDDVVSFLHADLVTWRPDLRLDGKEIMVRGNIATDLIDDLRKAQPRFEMVPLDASIRLRDARVEHHGGVLKRRLSKAHRVNYVTMADEKISHELDRLCDVLGDSDTIGVADIIEQNPSFGGIQTIDLLGILNHYRVLHITTLVRDEDGLPDQR